MRHLLLAEGDPASARLIEALLDRPEPDDCRVQTVDRLDRALALAAASPFDLILLDLALPGCQGIDSIRAVRLAAPQIPIVVLASLDDRALAAEVVAAGAQDYLVKSRLDERSLDRSMRHAIERQRLRTELQAHIQSAQEAEIVILRQNQILRAQSDKMAAQREELSAQNEQLVAQNQEVQLQDQALHASEARLRSVLASLPIGMHFYKLDSAGLIFTGANPAADRILGIDHSKLAGLPIAEAFPALADTELPDRYAAVAEGGPPWQSDEINYQDGRVAGAFEVHAFQFAPGEMVAAFQDITWRKQDEAALRDKNAYLLALQDTMLELAGQLDLDALLENVVRRAMQLTGASGGSLDLVDDAAGRFVPRVGLGTLVGSLGVPLSLDEGLTGAVWRSGQPVVVNDYAAWEGRVVRGDFSLALAIAGVPLGGAGEVLGVLCVSTAAGSGQVFGPETVDVLNQFARLATLALRNARLFSAAQKELAERQAAEAALAQERAQLVRRVDERTAELRLANEALARAARTKDEFLANMSHELRTPLTGILGFAEALKLGIYGPLTEKQQQPLASLYTSGQLLLDLINDILDLAKVEAGKVQLELAPVPVPEICQTSIQMVQQTAQKKKLHLSLDRDVQVSVITADGRRLKQMLVNLLSNAVKFTPEGGAAGLEVTGDPAGQLVRFSVWDTGIGIAPEKLADLFKPFVQLDSRLSREYGGTGLGLSLVLRMAELHGGSVSVETAPGKGSRFTVTLPWLPDASPAPLAPRMRRALVVEDAAVAADHLVRCLGELGVGSDVHSSGRGLVERALEVRPDVILLDVLLPDASGWEALQQVKADERTRDIPVVVVTVLDEEAQARTLGAAAFLRKPVSLSDLQLALDRAAANAPLTPPAPAVGAPLVLLADDNAITVSALGDTLRARGYRVITAGDGAEALQRAREARPDVILIDIQMPQMDGLEATRRLRAEPDSALAATPVIALTALAMPGDRELCLAAGVDHYLSKPVNLPDLVRTLEQLFAARRPA